MFFFHVPMKINVKMDLDAIYKQKYVINVIFKIAKLVNQIERYVINVMKVLLL